MMIDWKAHIEAEKRAEKAAMAPTEDGQEPIMEYWYNGDGAFAASFNQQNFGEIFSSDGVQGLAKKLVQAWRLHNDPSLDGLPVLVVMRVSGRHPSFIVETDRQRIPFETELEAMTFVRSTLKEAREKVPQH